MLSDEKDAMYSISDPFTHFVIISDEQREGNWQRYDLAQQLSTPNKKDQNSHFNLNFHQYTLERDQTTESFASSRVIRV